MDGDVWLSAVQVLDGARHVVGETVQRSLGITEFVALDLTNSTAVQFAGQAPMRGSFKLDAPLITPENADQFYFPDSPF